MTPEELETARKIARFAGMGQTLSVELRNFKQAKDLIGKLLEHIDQQVATIETLKAALLRERERYIDDFIHQDEPVEDRSEEAKKQLAREYPKIFAEVKE